MNASTDVQACLRHYDVTHRFWRVADFGGAAVTSPTERSSPVSGIMAASALTGGNVVSAEGDYIGSIAELMLDIETGCIAYAVIEYHHDQQAQLLTVPWGALTLDEQEHDFILSVERDKLDGAPRFDRSRWPIYAQDAQALQLHQYYGVQPYWHG